MTKARRAGIVSVFLHLHFANEFDLVVVAGADPGVHLETPSLRDVLLGTLVIPNTDAAARGELAAWLTRQLRAFVANADIGYVPHAHQHLCLAAGIALLHRAPHLYRHRPGVQIVRERAAGMLANAQAFPDPAERKAAVSRLTAILRSSQDPACLALANHVDMQAVAVGYIAPRQPDMNQTLEAAPVARLHRPGVAL